MNRTSLSLIAGAVVCLAGLVATVTAQQAYYTQQVSNCQQCYSTAPQYYQSYESVPQPVYYDNVVANQPATVYQTPVYSDSYPSATSTTYYSTPVVSNAYDSGQVVYSTAPNQVYYETPTTSTPAVYDSGYSSPVSSTYYPEVANVGSSYPAVSTPVYSSPSYQSTSYQPQAVQTATYSGGSGNYYTSTNPTAGLAQQKAEQAASMGFRDHLGGGLGGAKFEGVGWSNQSPQSAIENCCYWGQRSPAQIGISKSHDGCWYACVLYH